VFSTPPSWTTAAVPGFTGTFWAPDVTYLNGQYLLYYAVSTFGSQVSAIGMATSATLDPSSPNYGWTDHGPVIQSHNGDAYNTIDPSILQDTDGKVWMTFGSFWNGIYLTQLDPATGLRLSPSTAPMRLAYNSQIEASYLYKRGNFYYLFVNWGQCCMGVNSTYNIRVGRSTSVTGPYLDRNGINMVSSAGTLFDGNDGNKIGPGQMGIYSEGDLDQFSYHYYNANNNGAATFGLRSLYWTSDAWPSYTPINPNWTGVINSNWSTASNWSGGLPDGKGHTANFVSLTSNHYAVAIDSTSRTLGAANFSSAADYSIGVNGGNGLIFDATFGNAAISVTAGNPTIAAPVTLNDDLNVNVTSASTLAMTGGISGANRTVNISGSGVVVLSGANTYGGATNVQAGTLRMVGDAARVPVLGGGAGANITGGKLVFDYSAGGTDPAAQVQSILAAGFAQSTKFSSGNLRTSNSPNPNKGLGYRDDASNSQVIVAYTFYGDANVDGVVNALDFNALASNFGAADSGAWSLGDFNYDNVVNTSDFTMLAANFNQSESLPGDALATLVPEPASVGIVAVVLVGSVRRSRRRRKI
jgi:arabinan endo-1,5-alpha-L-arabinosidase